MTPPALLYVVYRGGADARFDREYYVRHHLPLVRTSFERFGLLDVVAFFPVDRESGAVALCECRFRDEAGVIAAFGSPEAVAVMADLPRFTDLMPERLSGSPFVAGDLG